MPKFHLNRKLFYDFNIKYKIPIKTAKYVSSEPTVLGGMLQSSIPWILSVVSYYLDISDKQYLT